MPRSPLLQSVARAMRIGEFSLRHGLSAHEAMQRLGEAAEASPRPSRRNVLAAATGVVAGATLGSVGRSFGTNPRSTPTVAIIGGGMAGMACAERLQRRGIIATVYESNSARLGGRIKSESLIFPGQVAELGGEMIDTTHQTIRGYARDLGLTLESLVRAPGESTYYFGGQHHSEEDIVAEYCEMVQRMRPDMQACSGAPDFWTHNAADIALDWTDLATYLDTRAAGLPLVRAVLDEAYVAEYGLEAHEQSCLNMLLFIHLDCRAHFAEFGVFSDERFHVVEGNAELVNGLAATFTGTIAMGSRLTSLAKNGSGKYVLGFAGGGTELADAVVLAVPFSVLRSVSLSPTLGLSADKIRAIDELGYGSNCKTMIGFNGRPWTSLGRDGLAYSDLPNVQTTWETSWTTAGPTSVLTDYASGDRARALQVLSTTGSYCGQCHGGSGGFLDINEGVMQGQAGAFLSDLDTIWPGAAAAASRNGDGGLVMARGHWLPQSASRGSYTCYTPGQFTGLAGLESESAGALKFAGEHADSFYAWQGFMEGAALSGIAAADEILGDVLHGRI